MRIEDDKIFIETEEEALALKEMMEAPPKMTEAMKKAIELYNSLDPNDPLKTFEL